MRLKIRTAQCEPLATGLRYRVQMNLGDRVQMNLGDRVQMNLGDRAQMNLGDKSTNEPRR